LVDGNVVLQDDNTVIEANIEASNGIIHIIDGVVTFFGDQLKIGTIALGETVSGVLEPTDNYGLIDNGTTFIRDYRDDYELVGAEAGQTITVTLESDVFQPYIAILNEFGLVDTSSSGTLTFVYDPELSILISAQANTFGDLGTYSLTVTETGTIADIATASPDLSSLVGALNADQVALLSDETQSLTVLAPVNDAFSAASDLLATLSPEQIATVINYHVIAGESFAEDIVALDGQTLPGTDITVSATENGIFLQGGGNDTPVEVIFGDIVASNGVVHLLDGILLPADLTTPEPGTIAEIATATPDLSALVGALNADQVTLLSDETQSLTVLAPVNAAFAAASDLLATLTAEQVATVINYHVLAGEFLAADVVGLAGQTLPNTDITVSVVDGNVFLQGAGNDAPVQITATDIVASNGVVHLLDGILLPADLIDITLEPDFLPDPQILTGITGDTTFDAFDIFGTDISGEDCAGFVASEPDYVLALAAGDSGLDSFGLFNVAVFSDVDTSLIIVNDDTGEVLCNDDSLDSLDPVIEVDDWPFGTYSIYVGVVDETATAVAYDIEFSAIPFE
jgi:transforming growth factor-beta-induced protein